jgi:hypothetical protein
MSTFGSNLELHEKIGKALEKITKGELSIHELENLSELSRELYERIVVLRYKAFESEVKVVVPQEEIIVEPAKEELIIPDEPPAIEFALFGEIQDVPNEDKDEKENVQTVIAEEETSPNLASTVIIQTTQIEVEKIAEDFQEKISVVQATSGSSLYDKLSTSSSSNRLADQLKRTRIESIVAVLTLNDKIRFTKNLFDSNSDTFNAAIQLLDAQKSVIEARDLLSQYATRYEWDMEDKNTIDFFEFIERRYA